MTAASASQASAIATMNDVIKGVVLRSIPIKEHDQMLTVYTHERGLVSIYAGHSRSAKGMPASCADFAYSEFVVREKGDKLYRESSNCIRYFADATASVEALTLCTYAAEVIMHVGTAEPEPKLMQLFLNTLYAACSGKYNLHVVKAAFEIRLLSIIGFMPDVSGCVECGNDRGEFIFDIMSGTVRCPDCVDTTAENDGQLHPTAILTDGARVAFDYCVRCPAEKLFSFTLSDDDLHLFCRAAESYIVDQLDYGFLTLDYFHQMDKF